VKSNELANLCADTIGEVAEIAEDGLDRIILEVRDSRCPKPTPTTGTSTC
jgi:hypothetical protein